MGKIELLVREQETGMRLDQFLARNVESTSRSVIQQLIRDGHVTLEGQLIAQPSYRLRAGQGIVLNLPKGGEILDPRGIELDVLYEDESIVVINKRCGVVVHPGAGENQTTLVEGLLVERDLPVDDDPVRPGIVHRLDKDTSGTIVIAKTREAMRSLKEQFASRRVHKLYAAVVEGIVSEEEGLIDAPIGRDQGNPRRMAITARGKSAQTEFCVVERRGSSSLLLVHLLTGRTHQIRIHMRYIGHSILGDTLYGHAGNRLMLHAWRLGFLHPKSEEYLSFTAPLPAEFLLPDERSLDEMARAHYSL